MFTTRRTPLELPAAPAECAPPAVAVVLTEATSASVSATSVFQNVLDDLVDANARLDDVEIRATAEIESLVKIRDAAREQRAKNLSVYKHIAELVPSE